MKKVMFLVVLAVLLASVFGGATVVLADDGENFKKAGQQALQEREEVLFSKLREIEAYVQIAGADRVVVKDEMLTLQGKVKDFNRTKEEADKYLKFYELKTSTELDKKLTEAVIGYFDRSALIKKDYKGEVRKFFVGTIGQDVVVQKGVVVVDGGNIFLIVLTAICLFVAIICALSWRGRKIEITVVFSIFSAVFTLVLFLF